MMEKIPKNFKIGWRFDNSYARLPKIMLSKIAPIPVRMPKLVVFNHRLSEELGLDFSGVSNKYVASVFSGNSLPHGSQSIAQAYAGHQFGYFTMLGDGRAILLGEHLNLKNRRFDIQLKGSGRTPYSRDGDGRAALSPVLREYIISEAMHALGIATTRSLAAVSTGESVIRENPLPGAILTRVAKSHIRIGTFQYVAILGDIKILNDLVNYVIERHYPTIRGSKCPSLGLLRAVIEKQIKLIVDWMRVGFVHGVMNTDNVAVSGETIDYGPCAFMDAYNLDTVFSSIDYHGRYSYGNQPSVAHWNLLRFAETLLPLIDKKQERAIAIVKETLSDFGKIYKKFWLGMMREKLGLLGEDKDDEALISKLLDWMQKNKLDYTNTFCSLVEKNISKNKLFDDDIFLGWYCRWQMRLKKNSSSADTSFKLMRKTNPAIIPRNHKIEEVLSSANENNDFKPMHKFIEVLKRPYEDRGEISDYKKPPSNNNGVYKTFCGT